MLNHKALSIFIFPILLAIGISLIPVVQDYSDHLLAAEAVLKPSRWVAGHLIAAITFGFSILAASTIVGELKQRSAKIPGVLLPFFAIGAGLYAAGLGALPGLMTLYDLILYSPIPYGWPLMQIMVWITFVTSLVATIAVALQLRS